MAYKYFNEEFKKQYLEDNKYRNLHTGNNIALLFDRIAPIEESLGKDLYDFSVAEILGYYKYYNTSSLESLMVINGQYKLYTAYAKKRGLVKDNQNHYEEITLEALMTCVHKGLAEAKVISRKDLLDLLRSSDVQNVSDRVICLGIFEGITGKNMTELTHLEPGDINTNTKTVSLYGGRKLKISDELISWALESAEEYNYYNDFTENTNKNTHYLESDTRIIKRLSNSTSDSDTQRHKTINRRLDRLISATQCNALGIGALRESGRLEMIHDLMEKDGKTLDEALKDKDMLYRYGRITSLKRYRLKYGLD